MGKDKTVEKKESKKDSKETKEVKKQETENEKTENYTRTLNSRFSSYLESTGKEFSELTKQDLINMSSNHSFTV